MAKDHGAPEARKLRKAWATGCKETESRQRASGKESKESLAEQILDKAVREKRIVITKNKRETTRDYRAHK